MGAVAECALERLDRQDRGEGTGLVQSNLRFNFPEWAAEPGVSLDHYRVWQTPLHPPKAAHFQCLGCGSTPEFHLPRADELFAAHPSHS